LAKRKKNPQRVAPDETAFNRWLGSIPQLQAITDVELLTLKIHLVAEATLQHLLAQRLGEDETRFKDLRVGFESLISLALPSEDSDRLQSALMELNKARNAVTHGKDTFQTSIRQFTEHASQLTGGADAGPVVTVSAVQHAGETVVFAIFERAVPYWKL
jgi:hypothetical protein